MKAGKPLAKAITLGPSDSLKIILTTQEDKSAKRPHQAFLLLKDATSNLDVSYPLSVKETGKAKVDLVRGPRKYLLNMLMKDTDTEGAPDTVHTKGV